jgi:hypothetical protein
MRLDQEWQYEGCQENSREDQQLQNEQKREDVT